MRRFRPTLFLATVVLISSSSISRADITFGGNARSHAMGGAGIAVVDRSGRTTPVNPAALALNNRRLGHLAPNLSLHASGVPLREAFDHLAGRPDRNDATGLARDFGKKPSEFATSLGLGMRFGHMDVRAWGLGVARIQPNAALQNWAKTANGDVTQLTGGERADLFAAGVYSLPTVGIAERISPRGSPTRIEAGARIKLQRAVYSHYIVSSANIAANTPAQAAPELGAGTTLQKDGLGVDFGLLVHPRDYDGFSGALVVTNLIEPGFTFNGTDVNGNPAKYDIQPRSISLGGAYQLGKFLAAFDAVDVTRAYSDVQGRLGFEYTTKRVSFRAGYSSARGFTAGFGWQWLQLAFGNRVPLTITETLRF